MWPILLVLLVPPAWLLTRDAIACGAGQPIRDVALSMVVGVIAVVLALYALLQHPL